MGDYICENCNKKFVTEKGCTKHIENNICKKHKCDICNELFKTASLLKNHAKTCTSNTTNVINTINKVNTITHNNEINVLVYSDPTDMEQIIKNVLVAINMLIKQHEYDNKTIDILYNNGKMAVLDVRETLKIE